MPDLFQHNTLEELSPDQQDVIRAFESGYNIFVTGSAGSGKSHLLNYLKRYYSHQGLEITASTGIAAVNIGGSTIHSWSAIGVANLPVDKIIANLFGAKFSKIRRRIKRTKALAIDEISMISSETLEILDRVFKSIRENDAPMGGLQILFFGDFLQLPPIAKFNSQINFCFESNCWNELDLKTFNLKEIFRQKDRKFINILNNIRKGELNEENIADLQKRVGLIDKNQAIKPTILTTHNYKVDKINEEKIKHIPKSEQVYKAEYFGVQSKIDFLKKNSIVPEFLQLKIGAQVMMIKNTYQKEGIINGSLGIIKDFSPRKNYPLVEFSNGKILTIAPEEWLIEKYDEQKNMIVTEAGVNQIPLILAWAMTIHKSQGLTLDKISCDLSDIFSPGQAYVALSRAKSLEGVFIEKINFNKITANHKAVDFYHNI
ncbi:MAG: AAA family ATPase [Rickettsiales bacterium]|nr:AAA family ATPase [Rickettsiales bacterium]